MRLNRPRIVSSRNEPLRFSYPYQVKTRRRFFFALRIHEVVFDDNVSPGTVYTTGDLEEARGIAALLNGAYNLGRSSMFVELS